MGVNLQREFANVSAAPITFIISVVAISALIWLLLHYLKRHQIANLESRLSLRNDEIADYKRRLDGATPEEAQERMARLELQVAALTPRPRNLSEAQRAAIAETVKDTTYPGSGIIISYSHLSAEAARFAHQIADALYEGGWEVPRIMTTAPRLSEHGLNLATHKFKAGSAMTHKLAEALTNAGLVFEWVEIPGLEGTLFVDIQDDS